jgi:hypothetical protein
MDQLLSRQLGVVKPFSIFEVVETPQDHYFLQVLKLGEDKSVFLKYFKDETGKGQQGLLLLDSNKIFNVRPELIQLKNVSEIPSWLNGLYINQSDFTQ